MLWNNLVSSEALRGKSVVVTGCDTGFGFQVSLALTQLGLDVHAGCLTRDGTRRLAEAHAQYQECKNGSLTPYIVDVSNDASFATFANAVSTATNGRLYAAIANAGIGRDGAIEVLNMDAHRAIFEVNYFGVLRTLRAFAPLLRAQASLQKSSYKPRFIVISSISGSMRPTPLLAAYGASKHAASSLGISARLELEPFGIQVTVVEPYFATTPIVTADRSSAARADFDACTPEVQAAYGEIPLKARSQALSLLVSNPFTMTPEFVVGKIVKCVQRKHLAHRYPVGFLAYVMLVVQAFIPFWIIESFMRLGRTGMKKYL
ncbi:hypothetical protein BC830DRAFT_1089562 [Chytriomyces sp. MP71]|nr:hypothetical protein BC830DRAFT_1089562 [Chytriomyces sp. MP71]